MERQEKKPALTQRHRLLQARDLLFTLLIVSFPLLLLSDVAFLRQVRIILTVHQSQSISHPLPEKINYTRGDVTCSVCEVAGGNPGRMALPPAVTHRVRPPYVSSPDVEPPIHVSTSTHTTPLPSSDFSTDAPSASDNSRALPGHRSSTTENMQPPQPTAAAWHPSYPLHDRPTTSATDCYRMSPPHTPSLISRKNATVSLSDSTKTSTSAVVL
jgi:hypothetical protein